MNLTGAVADCERIMGGLIGQPVNAITSLAFVVAGGAIWRQTRQPLVAVALVATGIGSFLFHGPMPPGAAWAHDASLAWLLTVAALTGTRWVRWAGWPAAAVLGVVLAVAPVGDAVGAVLAVAAIGGIIWRRPKGRTWTALGVLALGAGVGRLSATGGPWCDPDSLVQGHGFWHLAAATAIWLWATAAETDRARSTSSGR